MKIIIINNNSIIIIKVTHLYRNVGRRMDDIFRLVNPRMSFTFDHILRFINAHFVMDVNLKKPHGTALHNGESGNEVAGKEVILKCGS